MLQVSLVLPSVQEKFGLGNTYLGFAAVGAVALISIYLTVPGAPQFPLLSLCVRSRMLHANHCQTFRWLRARLHKSCVWRMQHHHGARSVHEPNINLVGHVPVEFTVVVFNVAV